MQVRTQEEIDHNEILDFEMISFEGHKPQWRPGQSGGPEKVNKLRPIIEFENYSSTSSTDSVLRVESCGFLYGGLIELTCMCSG